MENKGIEFKYQPDEESLKHMILDQLDVTRILHPKYPYLFYADTEANDIALTYLKKHGFIEPKSDFKGDAFLVKITYEGIR